MFSFDEFISEKGTPLIMGILNITPDSFSDGGKSFDLSSVIKKVKKLCDDGADIIDIGACSTAPNIDIVSQEEEIRRLKKFLPAVMRNVSVPVSIDTFRPAVAEYALSQGVSIINDESGIFNSEMAQLVKSYNCGWIFMHTGNASSSESVRYDSGVLKDVLAFFEDMRSSALKIGITDSGLCYDCGIGFGKSRDDDMLLLSNCDILSVYSPLLIGASRKRVIGELTGESEPQKRIKGSVAVAKLVSDDGAGVLRVHDVKETVEAIKNGKDNY